MTFLTGGVHVHPKGASNQLGVSAMVLQVFSHRSGFASPKEIYTEAIRTLT